MKPLFLFVMMVSPFLSNSSFAKGPALTREEKKFVKENLPLLAPGDPLIPSTEVWNKMAELAARTEDKKIYEKMFSACDKSDAAGTSNCSIIEFNLLLNNPHYTAEFASSSHRAEKLAGNLVNETQDISYDNVSDVVQAGLKEKPKHKALRKLAKLFEKNHLCLQKESDSPFCKGK